MQFGFMPEKKNGGCDIHCEEDAGGISKQGQEVVDRFLIQFQEK